MHAERKIDRLFKRQHGVISRAQALAAGLSERQIDLRLSTGKWVRAHPGVYRLAAMPQSWLQSVQAGFLWAGNCVASHRTAARLYGLDLAPTDIVEFLSTRSGWRPPNGVKVHPTSILLPAETAIVSGIKATDPTRTLIDLSSCLSIEELECALDDAFRMQLTNIERLVRRLERHYRGRHGVSNLRRLIRERTDGVTGSKFETRLFQLIRSAGLPLSEKQHRVTVGESIARIDFAYPHLRVGIEADGYQYHSGKPVWQDDLERGNSLTQLGWQGPSFLLGRPGPPPPLRRRSDSSDSRTRRS